MSFSFSVMPGVRIRPASFGAPGAKTAHQRMTDAEKQQRAAELSRAIQHVLGLHRVAFPPATAPRAPQPPPVNRAAVQAEHRRLALRGIGPFRFEARRRANAAAAAGAQQHMAQLEAERQLHWQRAQQDLDRWWAALLRNDVSVVLGVLAAAFADNEAPATVAGIDGAEVSLIALVPRLDDMPERTPDTTAAGNLTLRKLTKTERAELHAAAVASHVLRTVREAFAVAPGLVAARIVALQRSGDDNDGGSAFAAMLAARFERDRLDGVQWQQANANANAVLAEASSELIVNVRSTTGELRPLDVRREPDLAAVLEHVELTDAPTGEPWTVPLPMAVPIPPTMLAPAVAGAASPDWAVAVRVAVAVAWLLVLVIALAASPSAFLVMLALPLIVMGLVAVIIGRLRWAWIGNRSVGAATLAAGFVVLIVSGGVAAPTDPADPAAAAATTSTTPSTTRPTTTVPSTSATTVPSPVVPLPPPPAPPPAPPTVAPPPPPPTTDEPRANCDPSYPTVCIPPPPPDLDCAEISDRNFVVLAPDPHRLDGRDNDGIGCES